MVYKQREGFLQPHSSDNLKNSTLKTFGEVWLLQGKSLAVSIFLNSFPLKHCIFNFFIGVHVLIQAPSVSYCLSLSVCLTLYHYVSAYLYQSVSLNLSQFVLNCLTLFQSVSNCLSLSHCVSCHLFTCHNLSEYVYLSELNLSTIFSVCLSLSLSLHILLSIACDLISYIMYCFCRQ